MLFKCDYLDKQGRRRTTFVESDSERRVYQTLKDRDATPMNIEMQERKERKKKKESFMDVLDDRFGKKVIKKKELVFLFYNLSTMIESGVAIDASLAIVKKQMKRGKAEAIVGDVLRDIKRGSSLSEAIENTEAFPGLVAAVIRSGEESGEMENSFSYLSEYYEKQNAIKSQITSAMIYPTLVLLAAIVAVYFVSTAVLPEILQVIEEDGAEITIATEVLIWVSDFFGSMGLLSIVLLLLLPFVGFFLFKRMDNYKLDRLLTKLPIIGRVVRTNASIQFVTTIYILTSSGITINRSLEIAGDVVSNMYVRGEVERIRKGVTKGLTLSENMEEEIFGEVACNIIKVGEESGSLTEPTRKAAKFLTQKLEEFTKNLTELLTPVIILAIAGIVGFIVIGTLQPIFSIYS